MPVNRTTIRANVFSEVYNILNTNLVDPKNRNKQWIFSSHPDYAAPNFVGYPIIVINKAKINKEYELFDDSYSDEDTPIIITIFTTSNQLLDQLSDQVDNLMIPSNFAQFQFVGYDEDDGDILIGSDNVHFRVMTHNVELINID